MIRYDVFARVVLLNDEDTTARVRIEAEDPQDAAEQAVRQLEASGKYQMVSLKEVRAPQVNMIHDLQGKLKADPHVRQADTVAALKQYFTASNQAWLIPYLSG